MPGTVSVLQHGLTKGTHPDILTSVDKVFEWDPAKNRKLIQERGVSFEAIVAHMEAGDLIAISPGHGKFKHQKQLVVLINQYVYLVPCVEDEEKIFLKTIIPSRKWTQLYLKGEL